VVGRVYSIRSLGDTDWNAVAGTTGVTYSLYDKIYVEAQSAGTGYGWQVGIRLDNYSSSGSTGTYSVEADGYNSVEYLDVGSSRTVRVSYEIEFDRSDANVVGPSFDEIYWDDIPQVWSTWPDNWDTWTDEDAAFDDFFVQVEVDASNTTTFSDNWVTATGEVTGRYFRFRIILSNGNPDITPQVFRFKGIVEY